GSGGTVECACRRDVDELARCRLPIEIRDDVVEVLNLADEREGGAGRERSAEDLLFRGRGKLSACIFEDAPQPRFDRLPIAAARLQAVDGGDGDVVAQVPAQEEGAIGRGRTARDVLDLVGGHVRGEGTPAVALAEEKDDVRPAE